ncbi:MAG: ABC transporter permease subunit/CPBP intramembrane protease [Myxococcota bacterium]
MNAWHHPAWHILKKEVLEALRDRKTLVIMLALPLVLYPLLFLAVGQATQIQKERLDSEALVIALSGPDETHGLRPRLEGLEDTTVLIVEDAEGAVRAGQASAGVVLGTSFSEEVAAGRQADVTVHYDGADERSHVAEARLADALQAFAEEVRRTRLERLGVTLAYVEPISVQRQNVAPPMRQGGWLLGQVLPMLVSFLMIGAAFYPAVDLTAGEKERGTLQTLLTAPVTSLSIVAGKFGAVLALSVLTGVANLASVALVAASMPVPEAFAGDVSFAIAPLNGFLVFVCMILLGMMFGAVMMAVAVTARGFKDAQNYLTPLYLLCVFPLVLSGVPGITLTASTAAIPVLNIALAMKSLLLGDVHAGFLSVVMISTLTWTAMGLVLAARLFTMEAALMGDAGLTVIFRRRPANSRLHGVPTVGEAVTLVGVIFMALFYGAVLLQGQPLLAQIHVTQWGLLLAPTLTMVALLRLDWRETLSLRSTTLGGVSAGVLLGLGSWYVATLGMHFLAGDLLPMPGPQMEALVTTITALAQDPSTAPWLYLGVAVAPAVCEELLFRGVVLSALRRVVSTRWAIGLSATAFALMHMNAQQLPTSLVMGGLLGVLVVRTRSIWPAICLHALHNGLALAIQLQIGDTLVSDMRWALVLAGPAAGIMVLWRHVPKGVTSGE